MARAGVFRLARPLELTWAAVFVVFAGGTLIQNLPGWGITIAASLALTVVVILIETRRPSFHGMGWQWINPNLPEWWEATCNKR